MTICREISGTFVTEPKIPMNPLIYRRIVTLSGITLALFASTAHTASAREKHDHQDEEQQIVLSPFEVSGLGATVGGAKDASYFRAGVDNGLFPHPNTITAEGLFSEHDLPLRIINKGSDALLLNGEAIRTKLLTQPDARYLAQIGFSSGLDAHTWHREPLNLIAVVDKSGSMSGPRIELVKKCLHQVVSQLGPDDQLAIVLYGDRAHVFFEPTRATKGNRAQIDEAIDAIEIAGSTNMEEGLRVGFDLARRTMKSFHGKTRLMQFTDERPNVGDTSAEGFMGLMAEGSREGIGQTTVGVGEEFDAEMASKVSAVRGGNLFYFGSAAAMKKTFRDELDTLVTELAYDLDVTIHPEAGVRIVGVYGLPGEMMTWDGERGVTFHVNTVFLSKRAGAIYAAFAPEHENLPAASLHPGDSLARVSLSYQVASRDERTHSEISLPLVSTKRASIGLTRGRYLVSEYLSLKAAMTAHVVENKQEKAFVLLQNLRNELAGAHDSSLRKEKDMVEKLCQGISKLAGHGEAIAEDDRAKAEASSEN